MANRSSAACMICLTALVFLLITSSLQAQGGSSSMNTKLGGGKQKQRRIPSSSSGEEYVPVRRVVYRSMALPAATEAEAAVGYEPFELCQGCRCCSTSNASSCVDTSCCYSIVCNIPGKPYGTCAFMPHTCGCGDTNCTQPS